MATLRLEHEAVTPHGVRPPTGGCLNRQLITNAVMIQQQGRGFPACGCAGQQRRLIAEQAQGWEALIRPAVALLRVDCSGLAIGGMPGKGRPAALTRRPPPEQFGRSVAVQPAGLDDQRPGDLTQRSRPEATPATRKPQPVVQLLKQFKRQTWTPRPPRPLPDPAAGSPEPGRRSLNQAEQPYEHCRTVFNIVDHLGATQWRASAEPTRSAAGQTRSRPAARSSRGRSPETASSARPVDSCFQTKTGSSTRYIPFSHPQIGSGQPQASCQGIDHEFDDVIIEIHVTTLFHIFKPKSVGGKQFEMREII